MPTYAYRCDNCGIEFDRFQKFSDKPLTKCPECKGKVRRVQQASGVVFKGSGWYITDSKSSSSSVAKSSKKSDETTGTETKTDSQPAEKSEKTEKATPVPATATKSDD